MYLREVGIAEYVPRFRRDVRTRSSDSDQPRDSYRPEVGSSSTVPRTSTTMSRWSTC